MMSEDDSSIQEPSIKFDYADEKPSRVSLMNIFFFYKNIKKKTLFIYIFVIKKNILL